MQIQIEIWSAIVRNFPSGVAHRNGLMYSDSAFGLSVKSDLFLVPLPRLSNAWICLTVA